MKFYDMKIVNETYIKTNPKIQREPYVKSHIITGYTAFDLVSVILKFYGNKQKCCPMDQ